MAQSRRGSTGSGRWGRPLLVARPASVEEVQALVRHAAGERVPVVAWGSGLRQDWGPPQLHGRSRLVSLISVA